MIIEKLKQQLISALKAHDTVRVSVLRFLLSGIKNKEIELRTQGIELADEHVIKVIVKQIKQRNDSIAGYKKGNREDLVAKETAELEILTQLLESFSTNA